MTRRTLFQILDELMVLYIAFLTELFKIGLVDLIILENQIILQPLKGTF